MPRVVRNKADRNGKSEHSRTVCNDRSEANNSPDTVIFYPLPWSVVVICGLSSGSKWLYAKLNFDAWGRKWCRVGVGSLANTLGVDRVTIRRWLRELEVRGLIWINHERACCYYYLNPKFRAGGFIPLLSTVLKRRDIGWTDKMVICSLAYKLAGNDWTWVMQKELAEDLGVSVRTIQRVIAGLKARCEVQIRLRKRNRKGGNKYALTCGAVLGGRIFGADSHTTRYPHLYKKWRLKSYFNGRRPKFHPGDLSASNSRALMQSEFVFETLAGYGVHEKVARPLAFDDHHPFGSVVQAHLNGQILRAQFWQGFDDAGLPRKDFNLAGYVVAALNGARREGKTVGTTRRFREAAAKDKLIKMAKAMKQKWRPPSEAVFADRVRRAKRALGLIA